jgi:hypothetical protein
MRLLSLVLLGLLICPGARAGGLNFRFSDEFRGYAEQRVLKALDEKAKGKKLLVIGFLPNDFLRMSSYENWRRLKQRPIENAFRRKALGLESPFRKDRLAENAAATLVYTQFPESRILAHLIWRHESKIRALNAVEDLFECKRGRSSRLGDVFILGAGGSHGGAELEEFEDLLVKRCGRHLDLVFLADAIAQPLAIPLSSFPSRPNRLCLANYQQNPTQWIQGGPVKNCESHEISGPDGHVAASNLSFEMIQSFLMRLRSSEDGGWTLSAETPTQFYLARNPEEHQAEFLEVPLVDAYARRWEAGKAAFNPSLLREQNL